MHAPLSSAWLRRAAGPAWRLRESACLLNKTGTVRCCGEWALLPRDGGQLIQHR